MAAERESEYRDTIFQVQSEMKTQSERIVLVQAAGSQAEARATVAEEKAAALQGELRQSSASRSDGAAGHLAKGW